MVSDSARKQPFRVDELSSLRKFELSQLLIIRPDSRRITIDSWKRYIGPDDIEVLRGWTTPRFVVSRVDCEDIDIDEDIYVIFFRNNKLKRKVIDLQTPAPTRVVDSRPKVASP